MTVAVAVLALASYPIVDLLPLNHIRFLWGFRHSSSPMPPDVRLKAEMADHGERFCKYAIRIALVLLLLGGSSLPLSSGGLTLNNWPRALALGGLVGAARAGLWIQFLSKVPTVRRGQESHWQPPLFIKAILDLLGSFSKQFWCAFCINALVGLGFHLWVSVLIVAIVGGIAHLSRSVGSASGHMVNGLIVGILFVDTGTLVAPLTMETLMVGTDLYRRERATLVA